MKIFLVKVTSHFVTLLNLCAECNCANLYEFFKSNMGIVSVEDILHLKVWFQKEPV